MESRTTATQAPDPAALLQPPPTTIGRFTILGEIGRGANGVVYAARDPVLGRDLAIKAVPLTVNGTFRHKVEANFINEARTAAGLNHPHIVTVFDAGKTDQLAYIAMERLHGRDLHEHLYTAARMSSRQAAALMARVADAVHYAHKRGLIHRDIKPSNIFLSREMKPKVLDFGVAMAMRGERDPSQHAKLIGTPNYMSPEQAQGKAIDARSDVFSLGAILYELVTGKRAFDGPDIDSLLTKLIKEEPEPVLLLRPDTPPELVRVIDKALAKDVDARFQTAGELRNELAKIAGSRELDEVIAQRPGTGVQTLQSRRRPRWLWYGALTAIAALLALMIWVVPRPAPPARAEAETVVPTPVTVEPATGSQAAAPAVPAVPLAPAPADAPKPAPAGAAAEKKAPPPADGVVALAISPWGEVLVDGASRGVSPPLNRLTLPPGSYAIEVRNAEAPPFRANVEVKPGQTQTLRHRF